MKARHKTSSLNNRGKSKLGKYNVSESKAVRIKSVRRLAAKQFVNIIEHINDGLVVLDKDWHYVYVNQKAAVILLAGVVLTGCAISTVQSRKQQRYGAYEALTPEMRGLVDQGQIKVGMPMDAVYIAWGPFGRVLQGENEAGKTITWVYYGSYVQEVRYWGYRNLHYDYYPATYVRAQAVFVNGVLKSWQNFGAPPY